MNFLNFLTAGASMFNFNLQNQTSPASNSLIKDEQNSKQKPTEEKGEMQAPEIVPSEVNGEERSELFVQNQHLINEYMHLNIQLLNKKLETLEKGATEEKNKEATQEENKSKKNPKKTKKINKCGHEDKEHYAKGMCNNCYHRLGRTKKPWKCPHQKLYAAGMCQNCYINNYNKKKRQLSKEEKLEASEEKNDFEQP